MLKDNSILKLEDLKVWFPVRRGIFSRTVGHVRAVDGVSLDIERGKTTGLVGESGCGKTTLARAVIGLDPVESGKVLFDGKDLLDAGERLEQRRKGNLQMIFQDPFSSLNPRMTVLDIITEGPVEHGMIKPSQKKDCAEQLLKDVGMDKDTVYRYPHEFSGGQRQRISIARALSMKPKLVICDEAVSALDVSVQAQVINLLADLRDSHNLSYLFISHDLSVVSHISEKTAVMYLGRIVEYGKTEDIINNPSHPYTEALISAVPLAGVEKKERIVLRGDVPSPSAPPPGCPFNPRCPCATEECRLAVPALKESEDSTRLIACIKR